MRLPSKETLIGWAFGTFVVFFGSIAMVAALAAIVAVVRPGTQRECAALYALARTPSDTLAIALKRSECAIPQPPRTP